MLGSSLGQIDDADYVLRDLASAAQQYAVASETSAPDFDTLYNYGLVLQVGAVPQAGRCCRRRGWRSCGC